MTIFPPAPPTTHSPTKSVLISGTSSGIGFCCATYLAHRGYRVFAGYRQPSDALALEKSHPHIMPVPLEVTREDSIQDAVFYISEHLNGAPLSGLINNAGVVMGGPLEFIPLKDWREQIEVNLIGPVALIQQCLPLLRQSRGRLINIGSVAGVMALPFLSPYSVSKSGLGMISDALRVELKPWGIQVALIEAGNINTPIWEKSLRSLEKAEDAYPPGYVEHYGLAMRQVKLASQKAAARSTEALMVARTVYHALSAPQAKARYPVGREVQLRRVLTLLPDHLRDWLIALRLSL